MRKFKNAHEAVVWLEDHPMFEDKHGMDHFSQCFDWYIVMTDPKTKAIEKDESRNTKQRVWLECGPWYKKDKNFPDGCPSHDYHLDVGADTFEEACIKLAKKTLKIYGDYDPNVPTPARKKLIARAKKTAERLFGKKKA